VETRRITVLGLAGALILFTGGSLSGQRAGDALKGELVKITYDSSGPKVVVGLLHDVLDNAFLVNSSTNRIVPIPRDQVTDFRVLRGQEREWKKGLLYGLPVGAAVGALMYLMVVETAEIMLGGIEIESGEPGPLVYGLVGALYGAGIGAGIGLFFKKDRWDPVAFENTMPPSLRDPVGRVRFGLSLPVGR
jgi:hypothetical protein